jgi:hypothetical protein
MDHKSIEMTVRYSHLAPKHTLATVERLSDPSRPAEGVINAGGSVDLPDSH